LASRGNELVNRFVIGVDVEKYSARNVRQQDDTQCALDRILDEAADAAGLDRQQWLTQPGGDGELAILPADVDMVASVSGLVTQLDDHLTAYNEDHSDAMKIRLRVAMHMDTVLRSAMGYAGPGLVVLSRLLDSKEFKQALAGAKDASMALLVSEPVFHSVIESGLPGLRPGRFRSLTIDNPAKGFQQTAYLYIPGVAQMASGELGSAGVVKEPSPPGDGSAAVNDSVSMTVTASSVGRNLYISGRDLYVGSQAEAGE
jgi:class 3 adenylate cyclase